MSEAAARGVAAGPTGVRGLVDHLFRHEAGKMVASLTRTFGPARLDLAQEVVQEAMVEALKRWPFQGVPERPAAWLHRVARNRAVDRLRHRQMVRGKGEAVEDAMLRFANPRPPSARMAGEIEDDLLRLLFLSAHPSLPRDGSVALTLKAVCGFGVEEIARAFLTKKATVAQRLVRVQRRIRDLDLPFELPAASELEPRRDGVLEVLYLMFNEGYGAHGGDRLVRADLCADALRLTEEMARHPRVGCPEVHALAALLSFQASRLPAREDPAGEFLRLGDQDRSSWNRSLIHRGFRHLERAATGSRETAYHLQAAIAAQHALAPAMEATDWPAIRHLYDRLLAVQPSPVVALNRAVAVARVEGTTAGLRAVAAIEDHPAVADYHLLEATRGELLALAGDLGAAVAAFERALECPCSEPERRFLKRRLASLAAGRVTNGSDAPT